MTSYLTAFNTVVFNFNDDLIKTFPEENDFKVYRRGLEWLKQSNAKKICNLFKVYTFNYREKIQSKDETFFLNTNYDDVLDTNDEGIVLVINKLKQYWETLTSDNQEKIWEYLNTLLKLSDLVV
jgi:hypothetical protein